jgi:hypothetical protein
MSTLDKLQKRNIAIDMDALRKEISEASADTAIYVGSDSKQFTKNKQKFTAYVTVVVIHLNSSEGAYIHRAVTFERDFGNMRQRLMNEVYMAGALASELVDVVGKRPFAVHLDINPDPMHKSSICVKEATGFILGTMGFKPKMKPEAFAATAVSDRHAKKMGKK